MEELRDAVIQRRERTMMSSRTVITTAVACLGIGLLIWPAIAVSTIHGGDRAAVAVAAALPMLSADHTYVGSGKCKMCHVATHKSWKKTKMANAFELLKPGSAIEAKTKHGLDPAKDYTTDANCLACHTTGYGHDGGYAIADPNDQKAVRQAKRLQGVGCESCHGAGSTYINLHRELFMSKRKYQREEMFAAGMNELSDKVCSTCHNDKSPTFDATDQCNIETMKEGSRHQPVELKQRE